MTLEERIKGRKIGILGMARSGMAAAAMADRFGGKPFVSDSARGELLVNQAERLKAEGIPYETGGHSDRLLGCDYLVVSPGIPLNVDILKRASDKGLPIFSEIEFASWACRGKIIAVTGSNGKTTTTTLIGGIFSAAGFDTHVAGNIGLPFCEIVPKIGPDSVAVIEVSNFQLEAIADFKPEIALILNLTPDHLDRHGSFEAYKQTKYRITENQTAEDHLILNLDSPELMAANISTAARMRFFTTGLAEKASAFVRDGSLCWRDDEAEAEIIPCGEIMIPGPHNLQNAAAAVCAAVLCDVEPAVIRKVLQTFPGVEHRLENVGRVAGISFVNDSKATNVDSVCFALQSLPTPVYLIAGGRGKGASYEPIIEHGKDKIKGVIVLGEAKDEIFQALGHAFPVVVVDSLPEAVRKAFEMAYPGETILLSPGCASFDMFENFEHRGKVFKAAVAELKNGKNGHETHANQK